MKNILLLLIPATSLLYLPMSWEEFEEPKVFALITFACFAAFWVNWKQVFSDKIAFWLSAFTISAAISTYLSIDWHISLFGNVKCRSGLLTVASLLVFYLAASEHVRSKEFATKCIDIFLTCASIVSVYAICQVLGYDFKQWTGTLKEIQYTRPMSFLGHPNFMANYLAMALPFGLWQFSICKKFRKKLIYAVAIVLSVVSIFLSLSRGMIIAGALGVIVFFLLQRKLRHLIVFVSVIAVTCSIALIAMPKFRVDAFQRLDAIVTPGPARLEYPMAAIRIWKKAPFFGIGTDAFEIGFQNQRTPFYWQIERAGSPHRAHNDFLNILATQGAFGALIALMFTFWVAITAFVSKSEFRAPAIAAIVVFYVAGLTSFYIVATGILFLMSLALLRIES